MREELLELQLERASYTSSLSDHMNLELQLKRSQNNLEQCNDSSSDVSMVTTNM